MEVPGVSGLAPQPRVHAVGKVMTLVWSGIESSGRQLISLAFFFLSVRFLHPTDLGRFALALAFNAVSQIFLDDAIGESLVQKADVTPLDWDTGFTANVIVAVVFVVLAVAVGWPLGRLMGEPFLMVALPVLSLASLAGALGNIQKAYLSRALQFRSIAQITLTAQTAGGAATLAMAMSGFGYWALVNGILISASISSFLCWRRSPWKPRLRLSRAGIESRLSYVAYSMAIRFVYLIRDQSPLLIAGLVVDLAHLGLFSLALRVVRNVGQIFEDVTTRPLVSMVSREQHDIVRFGKVLTQVMAAVGLLALPCYVGLAVVGRYALPLLFGRAWTSAGAFLPVLCVVQACWLLMHIVTVSLRARARGDLAVKMTATSVLIDAAALAALASFGWEWSMLGWAARGVLSVPVCIWLLRSCLGVSLRDLMQRWAPPLAASLLMICLLEWANLHYMLGSSILGIGAMVGGSAVFYFICVSIVAIATHGRSAVMQSISGLLKGRVA